MAVDTLPADAHVMATPADHLVLRQLALVGGHEVLRAQVVGWRRSGVIVLALVVARPARVHHQVLGLHPGGRHLRRHFCIHQVLMVGMMGVDQWVMVDIRMVGVRMEAGAQMVAGVVVVQDLVLG